MEVPFSPEEQIQIDSIAATTGQGAGEYVREVISEHLHELDEVRTMLSSRYDDIKSGRVQPIDGEETFARLRARSAERRANRP
jgi:hypothetical protein